jgi:hypothetical protein
MVLDIKWKTKTMKTIGLEPKITKCKFIVLPIKLCFLFFYYILVKNFNKYLYTFNIFFNFNY